MAIRKSNGCPYFEPRNCECTHKFSKINRKGNRKCIYNDPIKCMLYRDWLELRKEFTEGGLK